jgi:hypothetical protein
VRPISGRCPEFFAHLVPADMAQPGRGEIEC